MSKILTVAQLLAYARKSLSALVGGVIAWAQLALPDHHVSFPEWIGLAVVIATALGVYHVSNDGPPTIVSPEAPAPPSAS